MENILVTGGCGFIGSHVALGLLEKGFKVTVIDSNINSSSTTIDKIKKIASNSFNSIEFIKGDIRNDIALENIFKEFIRKGSEIKAVIHLAGLKSVKESIKKPIEYWDNNVLGSLSLFRTMIKFKCFNIIFSSSATVYGNPKSIPIFEANEKNPINTYGETKLTIEKILRDLHSVNNFNVILLRYFNPIGAHYSGLIGENLNDISDNIFPNILQVALNKQSYLKIFGNSWPTSDGTAVRDFIHVMDLADAHIKALNYLKDKDSFLLALNIGTSYPCSILELIETFENINKVKIPYKFFEKRSGDAPFLLANCSLAKNTINWETKKNLNDMCKDGWNYAKQNFNDFCNFNAKK